MNLTDVTKLATLARVRVPENELEAVAHDMDAILGYVAQVQEIAGVDATRTDILVNIARPDAVQNTTGEYTEALLAEAPVRDANFLKVKQILS